MTYGSLIDNERQIMKKTVLSTTVAELCSFVKCFGSCQFLRGLWMDIYAEVANIHMRTDAKNPVTTARTIHLPDSKGDNPHDLYVPKRRPVQDVFMILLAFQSKIVWQIA